MSNKKLQVWLPLLFSITMIVGMYLGYKMRDSMPGRNFFSTEKRRPIQEIIHLIENRYVDEVNMKDLTDTAIQALLSKLDPHSVFIPAEELQQINEELEGKFYGIGVEFNIFDDTLNVITVLNNGPADKAGLEIGDKFLKINDSAVAGKKIAADEFKKLLRGNRSTTVKITILRDHEKKEIAVTRDLVPITSIDAGYMITNNIGYIRINRFSTQTYREFMENLEALKKQGLQKLILDIRDNGGGILDQAIEIADEFLSGDKLITYTEGKHNPKKEYRCKRQGQFESGTLVVLINEGSASASEVLAGALQDWDRADIIGRRTFGKGLVQQQYDLSDGSALRLTIARYYTPVGRSIQRSYANGGKAYYNEILNRYEHGEMQNIDSIKNDGNKLYKTKNGRTVYGGNGITPDYFIAIDTNILNVKTSKIHTKGTIRNFAYKYYLQNKSLLSKYRKTTDFIKEFVFSENDWTQFINAAMKDSLNVNIISDQGKKYLINNIKSSIARIIWHTEGFFETLNTDDENLKKAIEILNK